MITCVIVSLFPINSVSHDVVEVITGDKSIIIEIGLSEDLVNFLVVQVLSQFVSYFFQLQSCNLSGSIDIE